MPEHTKGCIFYAPEMGSYVIIIDYIVNPQYIHMYSIYVCVIINSHIYVFVYSYEIISGVAASELICFNTKVR